MNISLLGKNALVGGSSKGIGEAIARQLAESGANVTLMARNEEKMQSIVQEMDSSQGQKHQYLVVDFSSFEAYQKTISDYFKFNTVDILVNNTQGPQAGAARSAMSTWSARCVRSTGRVREDRVGRDCGRVPRAEWRAVRLAVDFVGVAAHVGRRGGGGREVGLDAQERPELEERLGGRGAEVLELDFAHVREPRRVRPHVRLDGDPVRHELGDRAVLHVGEMRDRVRDRVARHEDEPRPRR